MSFGVTVNQVDGQSITGYIQWNNFALEPFARDPQFANFMKDGNWRQESDQDVLFAQWVELFNKSIKSGLGSDGIKQLSVYKKLIRIKHPIERHIAIAEDVVVIPRDKIASIATNPDLKIRTDTTGLSAIPEHDAKLLESKPPRYAIEADLDMGATLYAVYGQSTSPNALLWHIMRRLYVYGQPSLKVNGTSIFRPSAPGAYQGPNDVTADISDDERQQFAEFPNEYARFVKEKDDALRPCEAESEPIRRRLRTINKNDPSYANVKSDWTAAHAHCTAIEKRVLDKYSRDLGDDAQLSKLGIIRFSYSWD